MLHFYNQRKVKKQGFSDIFRRVYRGLLVVDELRISPSVKTNMSNSLARESSIEILVPLLSFRKNHY